jgi:hypothetical protein
MNYMPIKNINVTNVFPTEPAPPGLNYYVAIKELPYPADSLVNWNFFLKSVLKESQGRAFTDSWKDLKPMSEYDADVVYSLGYNPVRNTRDWGPVIWGNKVVGTRWNLPQLMAVFEVMVNIKGAVDNLIGTDQMSLFILDDPGVHMVEEAIHRVIVNHKQCFDLYSHTAAGMEPSVWKYGDDKKVTFEVPLQPRRIIEHLTFKVRFFVPQYVYDFAVAYSGVEQYRAMQNLFDIESTGITLEA